MLRLEREENTKTLLELENQKTTKTLSDLRSAELNQGNPLDQQGCHLGNLVVVEGLEKRGLRATRSAGSAILKSPQHGTAQNDR